MMQKIMPLLLVMLVLTGFLFLAAPPAGSADVPNLSSATFTIGDTTLTGSWDANGLFTGASASGQDMTPFYGWICAGVPDVSPCWPILNSGPYIGSPGHTNPWYYINGRWVYVY